MVWKIYCSAPLLPVGLAIAAISVQAADDLGYSQPGVHEADPKRIARACNHYLY